MNHQPKNKAIFLDRDGVINDVGRNYYVYRVEDLKLNRGVTEALKIFQENGYLLIIISNQGGIARGIYRKQDTERVHEQIINELSAHGIHLTEIYYCPHHTKSEKCFCRKPEPLMLQKAMARFDIDPRSSWFIGDRSKDVKAGKAAGVNTLKIWPNRSLLKYIRKIR